jgi:8-oxo-(d)GTP phosphatase
MTERASGRAAVWTDERPQAPGRERTIKHPDLIRAAGCVVWRDPDEILLVHRPKYDDWSLPKGKQEPGEQLPLTAVREVAEEASVRPVLGPRLPSVRYLVRGEPKRVDYWSAVTADDAGASNEVDAVRWLPLPAAVELLSYDHDRKVVAGLVPRRTVPLIFVRHASAGSKASWPEDDMLRPLDAHGTADASSVAHLLACFATRARVLSSPAARCVDTVAPYAAAAGTTVETSEALYSKTTRGDSAAPLIRALAAAGRPAIVCVHRENLPALVAAACQELGAARPASVSMPKGAFLVLHCGTGGRDLAGAERYTLSAGSLSIGWPGSWALARRRRRRMRYARYATSSAAAAISTYSAYLFTVL